MILAIGNSGVYEMKAYQAVFAALERYGKTAKLFKQDKCLQGEYLHFEIIGGKAKYSVIIDGQVYDLGQFSAIWYMKPHLPRELLNYNPVEHRQFIDRQFHVLRQAIWNLCRDKKWLNDPWAIQMAESKIYQLEVAIRNGFKVPETCITSDPEKVKRFYQEHSGKIIVKLLAVSPMLNQVIYTNKVTAKQMQDIDSVKMSPSIFQEIVPKAYELRITVVGDKIFAVKIHSQQDEETSLDWRRKPKLNDFDVKMEPITLPSNIEWQIYGYMQALNLQFGCIDMIVTPDGDYIFLEINPNGQWYFVQLKTELQIAQAIAELLI